MKFNDYSHRHGKELLEIIHPDIVKEIKTILNSLEPFPHGAKKGITVKEHISNAFLKNGWEKEAKAYFKTNKKDYIDLYKNRVPIEMEYSRFEMFFRDFFRFMLLYERQEIDAGVIITLDEMAYERWKGEAKSYKQARASLRKLTDFLKGEYSFIVNVPIWCIGIE